MDSIETTLHKILDALDQLAARLIRTETRLCRLAELLGKGDEVKRERDDDSV